MSEPRTLEEIAHLLAGFLGKPDHEAVIHAAITEAFERGQAEERKAFRSAIEDVRDMNVGYRAAVKAEMLSWLDAREKEGR